MHRREVLATAASGIALGAAGCLGNDESGDDEPADGDGTGSGDGRFVRVVGSGEAEREPDKAVVTVGVEATGETAEGVRDQIASDAEQLRDALAEFGLDDDQVTTASYGIREPRRDEEGYVGFHSYRVELFDIDQVGSLVDAAVDAGADDVGRINFTLTEETRAELREEALDDALAAADEEAELIAENRGAALGETRSVQTGDVDVSPVRRDYAVATAEADDASGGTAVESGPVTVSARAEVTYDLEFE